MNPSARTTRLAIAAVLAATVMPAQAATPRFAEPSAVDKTAIEASFARADENNDGRLSRDETVHMPMIAAKFDDLDRNKDGTLSFEEFAAGATAAPR